ncbi:zinc finger protein 239-like [Takifugu flavidus]|uniref:zinc finger protein 239-like n=1 Tax=Takifugu flavidus TaxID=433684 RepID=UPI002544C552|nr:zinc finger protein 239-like [Takifugu flavidus]
MSSLEYLKEFVNERLTAAAEEIFGVFKRTIEEYEEELVRQRKMLAVVWKPEIKLLRTEPPQKYIHEVEEEDMTDQLRDPETSYDQNLEDLLIKEEQEDLCIHVEEEALLKQETDARILNSVDQKDDNSEYQTLNWNRDETADVNMSVMSSMVTEPTTSDVNLPAAVKNQHNPEAVDRPFKCDMCEKDFKSKANFQKHLRTHTGEKPYSCSFCSKNFSQRSSLNLHLRIHSGEKPYVCETCGKDFIQRSDLTVHIRRAHTGEKPYRCKICGKCFPANNDLSVHIKIHMGHKPFTCVTCGRGFRRGCQLTMHIRRDHIGEKRFICQICGKRYFNTYELSRHQRSHIKID